MLTTFRVRFVDAYPALCENAPVKSLGLAVVLAASGWATTVTFTMDEVSYRPIDGLTVSKGGITVTFSDAGGNIFYGNSNGGDLTYVQDPAVAGNNEPFSVTFSSPVYSVSFGMAAAKFAPATPIATISLFNGATLISSTALNSSLTDPSAEGQFTYSSGSVPVTRIVIAPATGTGFNAIAFDNLSTTVVSSAPSVPAVSGTGLAVLFAALLLSGCLITRRQRFRTGRAG